MSRALLSLTAVFGLAGLVYLGVVEGRRSKLVPDGASSPAMQLPRYGGGVWLVIGGRRRRWRGSGRLPSRRCAGWFSGSGGPLRSSR